jgi:hypothetical protein
LFILIIVVLSCETLKIPENLDIEAIPQKVSVQEIRFSFDIEGKIINSAEQIIEEYCKKYLSEINNIVLSEYNIILDEEDFTNEYEKNKLSTIFEESDHYMKKRYSWHSRNVDEFRAIIIFYDSLEEMHATVDIHKGGSREFPEYYKSLPLNINTTIN